MFFQAKLFCSKWARGLQTVVLTAAFVLAFRLPQLQFQYCDFLGQSQTQNQLCKSSSFLKYHSENAIICGSLLFSNYSFYTSSLEWYHQSVLHGIKLKVMSFKKNKFVCSFNICPLTVFPLEMKRAHHHKPNGKAYAMIVLGTHVGLDAAMAGNMFVSFTQRTCKSWANLCSSFQHFPLLAGLKIWVGSVLSVETEKAPSKKGFWYSMVTCACVCVCMQQGPEEWP